MSSVLLKKYPGGTIKVIAKFDEWKDKDGKVTQYDRAKIMIKEAAAPQAMELTKDAYEALLKLLADPEVKTKLKDWV